MFKWIVKLWPQAEMINVTVVVISIFSRFFVGAIEVRVFMWVDDLRFGFFRVAPQLSGRSIKNACSKVAFEVSIRSTSHVTQSKLVAAFLEIAVEEKRTVVAV